MVIDRKTDVSSKQNTDSQWIGMLHINNSSDFISLLFINNVHQLWQIILVTEGEIYNVNSRIWIILVVKSLSWRTHDVKLNMHKQLTYKISFAYGRERNNVNKRI